MTRIIGALLGVTFALGCGVAPSLENLDQVAQGVISGSPDTKHRGVAAMVVKENGQWREVCTATLISPTVLVTAGHCVYYTNLYGLAPAYVSFADTYQPGVSPLIPVTLHGYADYTANAMKDDEDIGVLVMEKAINTRPIAQLPPANFLDDLALAGAFGPGSILYAVGYGVDSVGPGQQFVPTNQRRIGKLTVRSIPNGHEYLYLNTSANKGNDGLCYGDSGGPSFFTYAGTEYLVATTVGGDGSCRSLEYVHRTDGPIARSFLANFVPLP
jgi:hypothetical protein